MRRRRGVELQEEVAESVELIYLHISPNENNI